MNLYNYLKNNLYKYVDPDGTSAFAIAFPILTIVLAPFTPIILPAFTAVAITASVAYACYEVTKGFENAKQQEFYNNILHQSETNNKTNPFEGPIEEDVFVGDAEGNIIPVSEGQQLAGTKDGKWIQVKDQEGNPTGTRKDGGGHQKEKDPRGRDPHAHRPDINNPDGTPWLPIY